LVSLNKPTPVYTAQQTTATTKKAKKLTIPLRHNADKAAIVGIALKTSYPTHNSDRAIVIAPYARANIVAGAVEQHCRAEQISHRRRRFVLAIVAHKVRLCCSLL
jgi:hypothetical protein